jgi:hypothetical protein
MKEREFAKMRPGAAGGVRKLMNRSQRPPGSPTPQFSINLLRFFSVDAYAVTG